MNNSWKKFSKAKGNLKTHIEVAIKQTGVKPYIIPIEKGHCSYGQLEHLLKLGIYRDKGEEINAGAFKLDGYCLSGGETYELCIELGVL